MFHVSDFCRNPTGGHHSASRVRLIAKAMLISAVYDNLLNPHVINIKPLNHDMCETTSKNGLGEMYH
jgi:hypothetical protein